ncbi:hypothetical protein QNA08_06135 [Chelatococcus sp. SYSU_G07232]|uniref:Uncharacterized protein n=1 Tax=Chelatococcus albus TaxID=3047466 RepID=A0ABT7AEM4_9HYPH|nr:hypothetical protein [Chelatococcus sp. SYSU_G07232]MDJ1157808.1 hypothetical protein [Chelatococcus sp. SYSU_G07232]
MPCSTSSHRLRSLSLALMLAVAGLAGTAALLDAPALAQSAGGNGGKGGGGDGNGGGDGGGGDDKAELFAILRKDQRNCLTAAACYDRPNQRPKPRIVRAMPDPTTCNGGIRIVYDINGEPIRYLCEELVY